MSCSPNAFAPSPPTGRVRPPAFAAYQATEPRQASPSPHENRVVVPARAAYSHSDSLNSR